MALTAFRFSRLAACCFCSNNNIGVHNSLKILVKFQSSDVKYDKKVAEKREVTVVPPEMRFVYPEFLPDPNMKFRNAMREKLERKDMLMRRNRVNIPEFYVGSILAVTSSNIHSPSKSSRFVGICIQREGCGLRATFLLRNVVDNIGVEMCYYLYDPLIQTIEVLKLEKRLDETLLYLRDALPEYSKVPLDMEPEYLLPGAEVPINPVKVKLKPRPWRYRYERGDYKGIDEITLRDIFWVRKARNAKPWEKHDLMLQYRKSIPAEEQQEIYSEIHSELKKLEITSKALKRKKEFDVKKQSKLGQRK